MRKGPVPAGAQSWCALLPSPVGNATMTCVLLQNSVSGPPAANEQHLISYVNQAVSYLKLNNFTLHISSFIRSFSLVA